MTSEAPHSSQTFATLPGRPVGSEDADPSEAHWRLPYPAPQLPHIGHRSSNTGFQSHPKQHDPSYVYARHDGFKAPISHSNGLSVDTYGLRSEGLMLPPPSGHQFLTYAAPNNRYPEYREPLTSPASDFSDDGSSSSEDRWSFSSPLTSPTSRHSGDFSKDPTAILLAPAPPPTPGNAGEKTLLDDFDPTPRAHIHYPSHLPHHTTAGYAFDSNPPSRNASYSSLDQLGYYMPERYTGPSPASSFISLPETNSEHHLRHGFQSITFQDGRNGLAQGQAGWRSSQELNSSINSAPGSKPTKTGRGRRATVATGEEPLHWASQTTTATKLAAIARRKPGVEAKFKCPYCGESFTRNYNLNGHIRAHRGERPFKCATCPKAFARAHDLRRHQELHLNPSKYSCRSCGKGFRRIEGLQKHYRQETEAALLDGLDNHCVEPPQNEFQEKNDNPFFNYEFKMEHPAQSAHSPFSPSSSASSDHRSASEGTFSREG